MQAIHVYVGPTVNSWHYTSADGVWIAVMLEDYLARVVNRKEKAPAPAMRDDRPPVALATCQERARDSAPCTLPGYLLTLDACMYSHAKVTEP